MHNRQIHKSCHATRASTRLFLLLLPHGEQRGDAFAPLLLLGAGVLLIRLEALRADILRPLEEIGLRKAVGAARVAGDGWELAALRLAILAVVCARALVRPHAAAVVVLAEIAAAAGTLLGAHAGVGGGDAG